MKEQMGLRSLRVMLGVLVMASMAGATAVPAAAGPDGVWEAWSSESYTLAPRESFQVRVDFADMPVRAWKLVVDGGDLNCDLNVIRKRGEVLLYAVNDESRHEVDIPWGEGEEIIAVVTNRRRQGAVVITLLGPPRDQNQAAYSYEVNRSLEYYAAGRRIEAEDRCRAALDQNPDDAVAKVLLAGFRRHRRDYDGASTLVDEALAADLTPEMRQLAVDLRAELLTLRAPLPAPLRHGITKAEEHLDKGRPAEALELVDKLLDGTLELSATAKSRLQLLRGRALAGTNRNFEALDAYMTALQLNRARTGEAVIYFHMGRLYYGMENLAQAQGAYTFALQHGLPSGLELRAREDLQEIERRLDRER